MELYWALMRAQDGRNYRTNLVDYVGCLVQQGTSTVPAVERGSLGCSRSDCSAWDSQPSDGRIMSQTTTDSRVSAMASADSSLSASFWASSEVETSDGIDRDREEHRGRICKPKRPRWILIYLSRV